KVSFPANAVNQQTAFMLEMNADKHFFLGPEIDLNKAAEISINTDGNRSLRLYRKSDQSDELISDQQFIDNQLLVKINRTGTFLLKEQQTSTHSVDRFKLYPNYPNPFNPITTIRYDLDKETQVELDVLNILGQRVKQLVYKRQKANSYQLIWDGRNESGEQLASGVYFYRLKTENQLQIRKMILIK
ncbi:MAG: T9SS type A sorting domain-containing protein, partial [Calditrichaeota bacterium]|nr:T9SS type A sorting domain-containing protein [Calditrichota bacterium]